MEVVIGSGFESTTSSPSFSKATMISNKRTIVLEGWVSNTFLMFYYDQVLQTYTFFNLND